MHKTSSIQVVYKNMLECLKILHEDFIDDEVEEDEEDAIEIPVNND